MPTCLQSQINKSCILIDNSENRQANPYQNQLLNLYPQNDSMEIFYLPIITYPKFYTINSNKSDTVFLTHVDDNGRFNTQKLWDNLIEQDSSLINGLNYVKFTIGVNWDGELFYIEAKDIDGNFDKEKWLQVFKSIKAIPSRECGILKEFRFTIGVGFSHDTEK